MQWCQWKPASLFSVVLQTKISLESMNFKMASGTCSGIIILYEGKKFKFLFNLKPKCVDIWLKKYIFGTI